MAKINFRKAFKEKAEIAFDEAIQIVAPTIFDIPVNPNEVIYNTKLQNDSIMTVMDTTYNSSPFVRVNDRILFYTDKLSITATRLLFYIIGELQFNSNIICLDSGRCCNRLGISTNSIRNNISELIKANILASTDVIDTFIINHNIIFKGDYNEFIKTYIGLYNARPAERDGFNRIKLKEIRIKADKAVVIDNN